MLLAIKFIKLRNLQITLNVEMEEFEDIIYPVL